MQVVAYQNGVGAVSTKTGGANGDGFVSWRLEGHWSLNQAGYAAIGTQVLTYLNSRPAAQFTNNPVNAPFVINDSLGQYAADNASLATQAASIAAIIFNTGYLNGGY